MEDKKRWRWKPPDYRKIKELKHLKKDQLLILLLAGILLLVISLPTEKKGESKRSVHTRCKTQSLHEKRTKKE